MVHASVFVYTSPISSEVAEEFDRWYDSVHIPQVVRHVDGIIDGRRHLLSEVQLMNRERGPVRRRLTIYDVDTEDLAATIASLASAMSGGKLDESPLVDRVSNPPDVVVYERG